MAGFFITRLRIKFVERLTLKYSVNVETYD